MKNTVESPCVGLVSPKIGDVVVFMKNIYDNEQVKKSEGDFGKRMRDEFNHWVDFYPDELNAFRGELGVIVAIDKEYGYSFEFIRGKRKIRINKGGFDGFKTVV